MIILSRALWAAQTNTYVIASEDGGEAVIVDAPPEPDSVIEVLKEAGLAAVALLLTHGHVDHTGGAGQVVASTGAAAYAHPDDDFLTLDPASQLRILFGMVPPGDFAPPDDLTHMTHGQTLELAGLSFQVIHTPGHSPGHCCFRIASEGLLLAGDQLFAGSIGRTDLPGGDLDSLATSMRERVMTLPDDTRVLPGHGPETTIGHERRTNPFRQLWG
ncbi:MAG TPA: MBL fold metallo-hydrolase [Acidimicrobiia bacterium]|nr:MBL fold metallo-hydrolase [Acidimicrobiia bacterium]